VLHASLRAACLAGAASLIAVSAAQAAESPPKTPAPPAGQTSATATSSPNRGVIFSPESISSDGEVTVGAAKIDYRAVAGTIVVHPKGWDDAAALEAREKAESKSEDKDLDDSSNPKAEASMFYVAYFKKGVPSPDRPITFLYNGGPGSSTVWLHMGAWGPRRVVTEDVAHTPAAPYRLVDNAYSLLDVSDLVFVDAPGTGFSRIAGKDKEKAFYGIDADAYAFSQFILGFLSQYGRWNSPKYLFGESYGTPRSAVLVNQLETDHDVDFNGVILLSQVLDFDLSPDDPQFNPGTDEAYIVALPTYAATAWYHDRLPGPKPELDALLKEVEQFATGDYAEALQQGSELSPERRQAIAQKLAQFTGLPVGYILKADLRISGGEFEKMLQDQADLTTGRLDTRFSGPSLDPLSKEAEYDPQSAAISSAYVSAFNQYVRQELGFGGDRTFKPEIEVGKSWSVDHQPPGANEPERGIANVMPDLASAMKYNPQLKVMVLGGYFDLATPFYEGWYEDHHLPIPASLTGNIEYHYYPSGHMVYAHEASLQKMHDDVATFIRRTDNLGR
jgi:carboxypeptidase C (cathepsin A)